MSEYGARTRRSRSRQQWDEERREQHVLEAREFTEEMGGTDQEVKQYFFGLDSRQLRDVLQAYGDRYGWKAQEYAEVTFHAWRSGRTRMSGMVAKRLFEMLPPRMPVADKLKLAERLWRHKGPRSRRTIVVGPRDDIHAVIRRIAAHVERTVIEHRIPSDLERRFNWLSDGDVDVKQMLLNHVEQMEKRLIVEGARRQLPVMLKHMQADGGRNIQRLAQVLKIGNHEIEIKVEPDRARDLSSESQCRHRPQADKGPVPGPPERLDDPWIVVVPRRHSAQTPSPPPPARASQASSSETKESQPAETTTTGNIKKSRWKDTLILLAWSFGAYFVLAGLFGW